MATSKGIPTQVRRQAEEIIDRFNHEALGDGEVRYVGRFHGRYLYLDRKDFAEGKPAAICRLEFTGELTNWGFAIYRYSGDCYDPDEWMFPGCDDIDGTIGGALRGGLAAYPPGW